MQAIPVIAIFDVGKTNKKVFLFDEDYRIVLERAHKFAETRDEDGDPCDDLGELTRWIYDSFAELSALSSFDIRAINFSSYGASLVHLAGDGRPFLPLYNYLKPYPPLLKRAFFDANGGEQRFARRTASPVLDSLNSGLQLYRLKHEKGIADQDGYSLHLPQYLSYLITGMPYSDITSIGCHTMLWDFENSGYHEWVDREGLAGRLAPVFPSDDVIETIRDGKKYAAGVGLHDSSSALIPYLAGFQQPFVLISTGTWCISLNPFNDTQLTDAELAQDCLCYLTYQGRPVKASRIFAGYDHEQAVKQLAIQFDKPVDYYVTVKYDRHLTSQGNNGSPETYEGAYHRLIADIISRQVVSTNLVISGTSVKRIFVDGGFSKNAVYMNMLAAAFPEMEVYAASIAQATALGAALAIHKHWNSKLLPSNIIDLKLYQ